MAYLLDTLSTLRLLSNRQSDPLIVWLGANQIRPYIAPVSLGRARDSIRRDPKLQPIQRSDLEKRLDVLCEAMDAGSRASAFLATMDAKTALTWGDLLGFSGVGAVEAVELAVVAAALRWSLVLVDGTDENRFAKIAPSIPPALGQLRVISADNPT